MLINVSMIGLLLKERNDAGKLGDDPEQVCKSLKASVGCHFRFVNLRRWCRTTLAVRFR